MSNTENQQSLRIFTIISQIEQLLENAPRPKFGGGNKRMVDIGEVYDLLGDLKVTIPEDIRRANSVLIEADTLLEHANQDAVELMDQAQQEADQLRMQALNELAETRQAAEIEFEARVAEDQVHLEVQRRCELLQQHAERSANVVYDGAKKYADAILQDLQRYLLEYHRMVGSNREELGVGHTAPEPQPAAYAAEPVQPAVQPAAQPVRMQAQPAMQVPVEEADIMEEEPEAAPRPPKRSRRTQKQEVYFEEEQEETEIPYQEAPRARGRRFARAEELDMDLDE